MKFIISAFIGFFIFVLSLFQAPANVPPLKPSQKVTEVLFQLGDKSAKQTIRFPNQKDIELGKRLFNDGFSLNRNGRRAKRLSKHFVCTSCHNVEKEFNNLLENDPQKRLTYAVQNDIPFLQGSTMYGAVNRISYYNGDYFLKYGDLVYPARKNLTEAIQLCAIECAQGRKLKNWELKALKAYIWTLGYKIEDLRLSDDESKQIAQALDDKTIATAAIELIKSKYLLYSPATFTKPPEDYGFGYGLKGNSANGQYIYEQSCLHCHENGRYSFLKLDRSKDSHKYLYKHKDNHHYGSFYQVGRYGTPPKPGKKAYMPQYTQEKMSDQQMEDLRAYLKEKSS